MCAIPRRRSKWFNVSMTGNAFEHYRMIYLKLLLVGFIFILPASWAEAGDLGGKTFFLSEGANCELKTAPRAEIGPLPELKKRLAGKKGIYCVSWTIRKDDYEQYSDPAIYIGRVGDVSEFYLNGKKIGLTSRIPAGGWYLHALHSYYYLPRWLLGEDNEAVLKVDKFFLLASGPLDDIGIGDWDDIRMKARLDNYLRSDLPLLLSILFVVVGALILGIFRNHSGFAGYRTFSLACFTGGLFSMSLSRVLYFFSSDYPLIYKFNCAAGILFFYFFLAFFYGSLGTARQFRRLNAAGTVLALAGIIFSLNTLGTSKVYASWLFFMYANLILLMGYTLYYRAELRDASIRATGIGLLLAATTHDILVYAGYATGGNMIPYAIFIVLFSFVFIVLTDMEQIYLAASRTAFAVSERNKLQADLMQVAKIAAIGQMASQVAHDIRSPLAALDASLKSMSQLPEGQRVMVRHAVNRIRDIANNLLEKTKPQPAGGPAAGQPGEGEPPQLHLISSLIDPVVTEKRSQFGSHPGINIDLELTQASYGLFAMVRPVELGRIVSNLVNNAVEPLGDKGLVKLGLEHDSGNILLTVADNGKGLPPEIMDRLWQRGVTHGKADGHGLGLYHARTTVESWGGSVEIASGAGKGTTVTLKLPRAEAPEDFVQKLELAPGRPVVVLDDDETIHHVWQGRLGAAGAGECGIELVHFSEPSRLRQWVKKNPAKAGDALYLFDYELLGCIETGLSLAQELELGPRVILVTSRHEEKRIIEEARAQKIRMIPKGLAGLVPIQISPAAQPGRAVLLDDDPLVHMCWALAAKAARVKLKTCSEPEKLYAEVETLPKDTPLYIDSELGAGIKGEDIALDLRGKGFSDITITTGHSPDRFARLSWLKVIGKEPPWA